MGKRKLIKRKCERVWILETYHLIGEYIKCDTHFDVMILGASDD